MIGVDGFHDPALIKIAGAAVEGTISGIAKQKGNSTRDQMMKDNEAAKFAEPAGSHTKNAFDAANIIAAVRKADTKDKLATAKAIGETTHDGALGRASFDENSQTKLRVEAELRELKNGVWTTCCGLRPAKPSPGLPALKAQAERARFL